MVHDTDSRAEFVARLKTALRQTGRSGRGEGAFLKSITGVTPKAASKWLNGETRPGHDNLVKIAERLGVREEWLIYGHGPMESSSDAHSSDGSDDRVREQWQDNQAPGSGLLDSLMRLKGAITPRSRSAIFRIAKAAEEGKISEKDMELLERIAARFEHNDNPS